MATDPETDYMHLNTNAGPADHTNVWNDTAPATTVFTLGTDSTVNGSGISYVVYVFAGVEGFSKFGSLKTTTASTDGKYTYTGFKPALVIVKQLTSARSWITKSSAISPYNVLSELLFADLPNAESSGNDIDFLSNGFKIRNSGSDSGIVGTSIYIAFAEYPFGGGEDVTPATTF